MAINHKRNILGPTSRTNLEDQPLGPTSRVIYKREGETPLEAIERYRGKHDELKYLPMTYAGRLDPMAHGELLCLVDEDCKEKDKYNKLDKIYEFEILVGIHTDTYDILGMIDKSEIRYFDHSELLKIDQEIMKFVGKREQRYPPFSSKTIKGKSMFELTKKGLLKPDLIPSHEIEIYKIDKISEYTQKSSDLLKDIIHRIQKVKGDFRQDEIKSLWSRIINDNIDIEFNIIKYCASVSSGTYVRSIVHELSERIKVPLCTFSIYRKKIVLV